MYKCPGCGAPLRFDPATQLMVCDHCSRQLTPTDANLLYENLSEAETNVRPDDYQAYVYTCPNCGAKLLSTEEAAVTFCSFCGSNVALVERLDSEEAPDVVIPFKITKEQCVSAYRKKLGKALFAPSKMRKDTNVERFRGIYMPYWIYSRDADGIVTTKGTVSHRRGDYIIKENFELREPVNGSFGGVAYDASSSFSDTISDAIAPFSATSAVDFKTSYMSGFYADVSDVEAHVYSDAADNVARDYFAEKLYTSDYVMHGVSQSELREKIPISAGKRKKGYFPVWFLANRSADQKHVSYAVVNGETGKVAADIPVSFWKYLIGVLLLAVPLAFLIYFIVTNSQELSLSPDMILFASTFLSVIFLLIQNSGLTKAYLKENLFNDKGYIFRRNLTKADMKPPAGYKIRYLIKPLIAGILSAIMSFIWNPDEDLIWYFVAIVVLFLLIWSVFDMVRIHNKLAKQKLPQFEKRGGDENA